MHCRQVGVAVATINDGAITLCDRGTVRRPARVAASQQPTLTPDVTPDLTPDLTPDAPAEVCYCYECHTQPMSANDRDA